MHKRHGFELIEDSPSRKVFYTTCACGSINESPRVYVEYDKDLKQLSLTFEVESHLIYGNDTFFKRWKNKLRIVWKILRNEPVYNNFDFIFRGRNHIDDFTDFINLLGKDCIKESNELIECRKRLNSVRR